MGLLVAARADDLTTSVAVAIVEPIDSDRPVATRAIATQATRVVIVVAITATGVADGLTTND